MPLARVGNRLGHKECPNRWLSRTAVVRKNGKAFASLNGFGFDEGPTLTIIKTDAPAERAMRTPPYFMIFATFSG